MSRARKIPRGQLYFQPGSTLGDLARHLAGDAVAGPLTQKLEAACASELGAAHAVLLSHARVALHALLQELALPSGSGVLMTPVTIPDVVNVVLDAGLVPQWVDLGRQTANIDSEQLAAQATARSRLVLLTHLCGFASDMDAVGAVAEARGLEVLEDVSQGMGGRWRGRCLGRFGRAGFFSLTTLKPLSSFTGGLVITDDAALAGRLRARAGQLPAARRATFLALLVRDLVLYGASDIRLYPWLGHWVSAVLERLDPRLAEEFQRGNILLRSRGERTRRQRLDDTLFVQYTDTQAAIGLRMLPTVAPGNARRRALADRLLAALDSHGLPGTPRLLKPDTPSWWRFPYWTDQPAALRRALRRDGIDSAATNLICATAERAFAGVTPAALDTPNARRYTDQMVFLPLHPNMTEADMDRIAVSVARFEGRV